MTARRFALQAVLAGVALAALPPLAQAQARPRRIGFVWESVPSPIHVRQVAAFKGGMRELGYTEGRDYVIEQRSAENDLGRLPAIMTELLTLKADLIVSGGTPSALAARKATRETPILTVTVGDPVGAGLAESLRRPGGNVTGTMGLTAELYIKRLDLLRQIQPGMLRVGLLYDPNNASDTLTFKRFESECRRLDLQAIRAAVGKVDELTPAFNALQRDGAQGLVVPASSLNNALRHSIVDLAARHRLPAIYSQSYYVDAGGLISYAANNTDLYRRAAAYADKIFKGARPGELPIEQPTKFELAVNLKTAKALGITVPQAILIGADKVIE